MRLIIALLLFTVAANAVPPAGDYVVVLNDQESPRIVTRDHGIGPKKMWTNAVHGFHATLTTNHLAKLERDTRVTVINTNMVVHTCAQTLPYGVRRIGCTNNALWLASSTVPINCDVAVLDTGIDYTHPDLYVYQHVNFTTDADQDGYGHGTHCAGIIGALNNGFGVVGVAPGVRLWSVKVMWNDGSGTLASLISGVDYVTQHSAEIEVASMSLGGLGNADSLRLAIQGSVAHGVVYVVSAGNSGVDIYGADKLLGTSDDFYPASFPEVMAVSAMADTDGVYGGLGTAYVSGANTYLDDTMARFSNYSLEIASGGSVSSPGLAIDIAAPGVHVYSTAAFGTNYLQSPTGYTYMSGTSMACPHVSGAVALYIAQYGRATSASGVYAIRQAIINAGEPPTSWGKNPWNAFPNIDFYPEPLVKVDRLGLAPIYPVVRITSPQPQQVADCVNYNATDTITFSASAIDATDGDISANLVWRKDSISPVVIGTGASFDLAMTTTTGQHPIFATVTNSTGKVGQDVVCVNIAAVTRYAPTVTIVSPLNGAVYGAFAPVTLTGTATDTVDGTLSSHLHWTSSLDGALGNGANLVMILSAGTHVITASAVNTIGMQGVAKVTITMGGTPPPPPPVNYPPVVAINQPGEGESFPQGTTVVFTGTASDAEDGDVTANIKWSDSVFGPLGTGGLVSTNGLALGPHTITANVADSVGATAMATRHITMTSTNTPNVPPTVSITAPAIGTTITVGSALTFQGTATDPEDGAITPTWNSSLDGSMATSTSFAYTLATVGTHTITARAVDTEGAEGSASIMVIVNAAAPPPVTNTAPVVTITQPASNVTIPYGQSQTLICTAIDAQEGVMTNSVVWNDSLTGYLGGGGTVTMTTPAAGTHVVTAKVTDAGGLTGSASRTVIVQAPVYPLAVTVTASPTTVVNKQKVLLSTTVTANALPVSGITVNFSVKGASGKVSTRTLTTGAAGTASYYFQVNRGQLGAGVATVTVNASKTGYTSGVGSATFTVR